MAGGIWEALGAALQSGSNTYRDASAQQLAQRRAEQQMQLAQAEEARQAAAQKQTMELQRLQMEQMQEDRKRKILETAIEHAQPGDAFTPDQFAQAQQFGLGGMMRETPALDGVAGGTSLSPATTQTTFGALRGMPADAPQHSIPLDIPVPQFQRKVADLAPQAGAIQRRFTPAEEAARAQQEMLRDVFKGMQTPSGPTAAAAPAPQGGLTPNQRTRFGLSMIPGVNPNEIMGTVQPPNPFEGAHTGEKVLEGLSPQEAMMVKKMANYELPIPGGNMRSPQIMSLMAKAAAYDPSFDATQYTARQKVRNDFTSGGVANNVQALNTTLNHMAKLSDAAEKLNNFGSPLLNAPINWIEQHGMGDERQNNYNILADAVAAEAAKVFKGGMNAAPATAEINEWRRNLSPNMSPDQFRGSMQSLSALLEGRLSEIQQRWGNAFGDKPLPFQLPSVNGSRAIEAMGGEPMKPVPSHEVGGQPAAAPQRVATVAQINAYASAKGIKPVDAAKQLQAEGWTINGR